MPLGQPDMVQGLGCMETAQTWPLQKLGTRRGERRKTFHWLGAQLMLVYELMRCDLHSALRHDESEFERGERRTSVPIPLFSGV